MAIKNAAQRAALADGYRVEYLELSPRGLDRYLSLLFGQVAVALRDAATAAQRWGWVAGRWPQHVAKVEAMEASLGRRMAGAADRTRRLFSRA